MATAIAAAEVIPYALPFKERYETAAGALEQREIVLLRIRGADGGFGLGEAVPLSLRGGEPLATVVEELRGWADAPAESCPELSAPARCAVETALIDLEARVAGVPVWKLLGATDAAPIECNATLGAGQPLHVAQRALEWAEAGFGSFKLKVGMGGDADQVALVRRAVGPKAKLRVDANGAWEPDDAVDALNAMHQEARLELAEQPCPTLDGMAAVRDRVEVPLAADESVADRDDARAAVEQGACEMATVKLSKAGGPAAALAVAGVLPVWVSSALDGPVGIAAAAHTVQALPPDGDAGVAHGLATQHLLAGKIASRRCELEGGFLHLPEGPGLGVEIDDAALERHRL